jgi:glycerol uptake facilitator-like aquaporin
VTLDRDFWVYVIGPVLGAMIGTVAYEVARGHMRAASE